MPYNRWIGQAVATQEVKYFIPQTVGAGDRFQFSDGLIRNGYTYPVIPPEVDLTATDRARRVVEALVSGSTTNADLGGGTTTGLTYSSSNYNGQPAVRVSGLTDGQPIGIVATAVSASGNAIKVQQVQEGSSGTDFQFTLKWPTTPTAGSWAIAADGKQPVILAYNANAAALEAALDTFDFPCSNVTVTGSHSAGYTVTLEDPSETIVNPPVLFPIVPVEADSGIIDMTFLEEATYHFGSSYSNDTFEANITAGAMITYLSAGSRLGSLSSDVTCVSTRITPSSGYSAGVTMRFTFATKAAYDAFVAMAKTRYNYTWNAAAGIAGAAAGYRRYETGAVLTNDTTLKKIRQYPILKVGASGTLNPFDRKFHSPAYLVRATSDATFVINDALGGYDATLVQGRPQTAAQYLTTQLRIDVESDWTSGTAEAWSLVHADIEMHVGLNTSTTSITSTFTVIQSGFYEELGVDNNAGWTVETVGTPGIINQEILIPALDGNFQSLYQFSWGEKRSFQFTGASTIQLIKDAAESLWGAGNVAVGIESGNPYICRIQFIGALAEQVVSAGLLQLGNSEALEVEVDIEATTPMQAWVLRYRFTGGICSGEWNFVNDVGDPQTTAFFKWLNDADIEAEELRLAIISISADYADFLEASDITVVNETVGRQSLLREFTITWQAQPGSTQTAGVAVPFWMGIDATALKTAEPYYEAVNLGGVAQPEIQVVAIENKPTSGTWALLSGASQTADLNWNASAANVQSALSGIGITASVIGGNGGAYRIRWSTNGAQTVLTGVDLTLARSGTPTFDVVTSVSGTGPKHFDNADNWSLGRVPIDGDTIVYSDGSIDCSYGLTCTTLPLSVDIYRSYGGRLGLPEIRDDGSMETLPLWLTFSGTSGTALVVRMGLGDSGDSSSIVRIAVDNRPFDCMVLFTQTGLTQKAFAIKGENAANKLVCVKGDVALGIRPEDASIVSLLQITPSQSAGDEMQFLSSGGAVIDRLSMQGGAANLGKPPTSITMIGGTATVNGDGDCESMDIVNATVRWLANGTLGEYGTASQVQFGAGFTSSSASPAKIRIVSTAHGLSSGQRVYMRAYSGVMGIDGEVYSVSVIDANTFDLLGSLGYGTLTGYTGLVTWAVERSVIVRSGSVLDFDSDGRTRDVVAPIVIQSTGIVTDSKVTISDLRIWPEQVESLLYMGQSIELRRNAR